MLAARPEAELRNHRDGLTPTSQLNYYTSSVYLDNFYTAIMQRGTRASWSKYRGGQAGTDLICFRSGPRLQEKKNKSASSATVRGTTTTNARLRPRQAQPTAPARCVQRPGGTSTVRAPQMVRSASAITPPSWGVAIVPGSYRCAELRRLNQISVCKQMYTLYKYIVYDN